MFKAASTSALLNALLSTLQIALGIGAHSDGLFADGIHSLSDLAADAIVLGVLFFGVRRASANAARLQDSAHAPDDNSAQALASFFIAALLIFTAVQMLWHSVDQTASLSGDAALRFGALTVSAVVTLAKEALFRYLRAASRRTGSALLMASAWHARVDAVSGLVATVGIAGSLAGVALLDHIAGAAIGLMILRMGYTSARDAVKRTLAGAHADAGAHRAHHAHHVHQIRQAAE